MADKCFGCIFAEEMKDMDTIFPICCREHDFIESSNARRDPNPCPWYITRKEIIRVQNNRLL